MIDPCLKRLNIFDLFDNVWSVDDFEYRKSDYRIYQCAAKKLNSSEETCIFIDDNLNAIKEAKMTTVGIYDKSSESFAESIKKEADFYIYDMSELLEIKGGGNHP